MSPESRVPSPLLDDAFDAGHGTSNRSPHADAQSSATELPVGTRPAYSFAKGLPSNARPGVTTLDALSLAEGGLLADVGVVLHLASVYLPLVGTVLAPTVPTPFAILTLRRGPRVTLLASAVATFLVTVLAGPHFGWRMGLEAVVGLLLGWAMRRRARPLLILGAGTLLVATTTFGAALGVIFLTGLPIHDVVGELRNGLGAVAWAAATGMSLFGGQARWLSIRPALVAAGLAALRFWPLLLYLYVMAFALPTVTLYYAVANAAARVLGYDIRQFPPRWSLRMARFVTLWSLRIMRGVLMTVTAPFWGPARLLRRGSARARKKPTSETHGAPPQ